MRTTLWQLPAGSSARLAGFDDALDSRYRARLVELGFQPGEAVTCVLSPPLGAPRLYRVSSSVFSLEDTIAERVLTIAEDA